MPTDSFNGEFATVTEAFPMRPGVVTADFLEEGASIPCYSDGMTWNGWGKPMFDEENARKVVALFSESGLTFRESDKVVIYTQQDEEPCEIAPRSVQVGAQTMALYDLSNGWTWDRVQFDDEASDSVNDEPAEDAPR
jgi:hypothetical protein